jgi:hypothetical protein
LSLEKAEVSFMSKSHKSSVNTLVKGARTMNFLGHIFLQFFYQKNLDFNLHKKLLAKEWPKLARFQK